MNWGDWIDLKIMDFLAEYYLLGAFAILAIILMLIDIIIRAFKKQ